MIGIGLKNVIHQRKVCESHIFKRRLAECRWRKRVFLQPRYAQQIGPTMITEEHYRRLESMYAAAPINAFFRPRMHVQEGCAEIEIDVLEKYFHAAGAVHGSVYFKMLDDAAFFASNSYESEVFVLTTAFTTYLTRPVSSGVIKAIGRVANKTRSQFIAEAVLQDADGNELGRGSGIFVRGKIKLCDALGYGSA